MPVIVKHPVSTKITDWVNQEDSVIENPWMQALKKVVKFSGITDPNSQMEGLMNPMSTPIAPLVSLFKNKVTREVGTTLFTDVAKKIGGPMERAGQEFAKKYPRVAAHMDLIKNYDGAGEGSVAYTDFLRNPELATGRAKIGIQKRPDDIQGYADTLGDLHHEGTHVSQSLGNSRWEELYDEAEKKLGYNDNPGELTAWYKGNKAANEAGINTAYGDRPPNAIKALEGYAQDLGPDSKLAKIFAERAARLERIRSNK